MSKICRLCCCGVHIIIRVIHTALVLGLPITLITQDTELRRALYYFQRPVYAISYIVLLLFSLVMYFLACLVDPGYLPLSKKKILSLNNNSDEEDIFEDSQMNKNTNYRHCDFCEVQQPMRSKHCEDCKRCVRKYDHHCPWLEACVGERNHKFFWLFLLSIASLILWTIYITWESIVYKLEWIQWLESNALLFCDLFVLIVGGMVVFGLLSFHSYLIIQGLTTWEFVSRDRITYLKYLDDSYNPFDEGCLCNLYHFLFHWKLRRWETVYAKKADAQSTSNGGIV